MGNVNLVLFDIAGTTAKDDGLVVQAFQSAMLKNGFSEQSSKYIEGTKHVNATMGQRKIDVFNHIFDGDLAAAQQAHEDFNSAYIEFINMGHLSEFEGVSRLFRGLAAKNIGIGLTTGFPRKILDSILSQLNWKDLVDVSVASDQVEHGRPAPDMIFRSITLFNTLYDKNVSVNEVVVVGDTDSDMKAGVAAEVQKIVGVTSGAMTEHILKEAGASLVLPYATDLLSIIN